jgi:dTMP kinase
MTRGHFITFEGGEGVGKSTQVRLLAAILEQRGIDVVVTREPGGSPGAEALREVLLSGVAKGYGPFAETLLFAAARDDHLEVTIRPALQAGRWVLCDRFTDSTRAYQGVLGDVDPALIRAIERVVVADTRPDLTFVLDLPATEGLRRAKARGGVSDRFERETIEFHERLREAFLAIARREPTRCIVIDANRDPANVAADILKVVEERFRLSVEKSAP